MKKRSIILLTIICCGVFISACNFPSKETLIPNTPKAKEKGDETASVDEEKGDETASVDEEKGDEIYYDNKPLLADEVKKLEINKSFKSNLMDNSGNEYTIKSIKLYKNIKDLKDEKGAIEDAELNFLNTNFEESNLENNHKYIKAKDTAKYPMLVVDCEIKNTSNQKNPRINLILAGELKDKGIQFISQGNFHNRNDLSKNKTHGIFYLDIKKNQTEKVKIGFTLPVEILKEKGFDINNLYIANTVGDKETVGLLKIGQLDEN